LPNPDPPYFLPVFFLLAVSAFFLFYFRKKLRKDTSLAVKTAKEGSRQALESQAQFLDEEKRRLSAILESMTEAVIVVDTDQIIRLANSALSRSFELNREAVLGLHFWEVFRDSELNQMIEQCLAAQSALKKEHTLPLSSRVFEIQISPVFSSKEFIGIVAVFHDVTQIKTLENMRSEFVANVSHELKTPLTSIMGFVETLKEGAGEDPKDRARFLDIIDEQSKRLYELIEGLLTLSQIESAGYKEIRKEPVDLKALCENLFAGFETLIKKNKIRVSLQFERDPFTVPADKKALTQAFANLIDNAIKYNKPGGEIDLTAVYEPDFAVILLRDSGIGIPEGDLKRIFERFYRVDKSRSRDSGGTGLGLSIVKHIIENHGGGIEASSPQGQGALFTIRLPRNF
jgi:two-component system phosphate regulon sensor histidine kinase PhoR